jgi:hypothetical protein
MVNLLPILLISIIFHACQSDESTTQINHSKTPQLIKDYTLGNIVLNKELSIYTDFDAFSDIVHKHLDNPDYRSNYDLSRLYVTTFKYSKESEDTDLNKLTYWCEKDPNSHIPFLVRGIYYSDIAWDRRGGKYAKDTSKEQFNELEYYSKLSKLDLDKAYTLNQKDPNISSHLMIVALALGLTSEVKDYFLNAQKSFKGDFYSLYYKLNFYKSKWYGASGRRALFTGTTMRDVSEEADNLRQINPLLNRVHMTVKSVTKDGVSSVT